MIKYVIFDIDGVVLNTEAISYQICNEVNEKYHLGLTDKALLSIFGVRRDCAKKAMQEAMPNQAIDYETFRYHFDEEKTKYLKNNEIEVKKGFIELAKYLHSNGIKIACASSTLKDDQIKNLKKANVLNYFDYTTFGEEASKSKPDPDIFLVTMAKYPCNKNEVFIVEDSINGINAGYAAGARVIHVPDIINIDEDIAKMCYKIVPSLDKIIEIIEEENR